MAIFPSEVTDDEVPAYLVGVEGLPDELAALAEAADFRRLNVGELKRLTAAVAKAAQRVRNAREHRVGNSQQILLTFGGNSPGNSNSGRSGLPYAKRREIIRLVEDGRMSDSQISRECGIHLTTIIKIRKQVAGEIPTPESPYVRCGGCGALIDLKKAKQCTRCLAEKTAHSKRLR